MLRDLHRPLWGPLRVCTPRQDMRILHLIFAFGFWLMLPNRGGCSLAFTLQTAKNSYLFAPAKEDQTT